MTTIRPETPSAPGRPLAVENDDGSVTYVDPSQAIGKRAPRPAGQKPFQFKATDSNTIYRQAAGLYGGMYDPLTGRITGIEKGKEKKVQFIAATAARLMKESGGELDHASAVEKALAIQEGGHPGGGAPSAAAPPAAPDNRPPLSSFRSR